MSAAVDIAGGVVRTSPPKGRALVFDRDWVVSTEGPVSAVELPQDVEPSAVLTRFAEVAVAAADGQAVSVTGAGAVAEEARRLLQGSGRLADGDADRCSAIVETTGDPEEIKRALSRADVLGTVVLAGETTGRTYDLDLYVDVHLRGLRLKGVPRPDEVVAGAAAPVEGGQELSEGDTLDPAARYYVIRGEGA